MTPFRDAGRCRRCTLPRTGDALPERPVEHSRVAVQSAPGGDAIAEIAARKSGGRPVSLGARRVVGGDDAAFVLGLLLGVFVLFAFGFVAHREEAALTNDFSYIWTGPRLVADGGNPYDPASYLAAAADYGTARPHERVYGYPPWVALGLLPLGILPLSLASATWTIGGMLLAALAVRAVLRTFVAGLPAVHTLAGLALLASQPATATVWSGQWSFVIVAALAGAVVALRSRGPLLHLTLLALLGKPQLTLFAMWAFIRSALARRGLAFTASVVAALVAAVVVGLVAYPDWPSAWRTEFVAERLDFVPPTTLANAFGDAIGAPGVWLAAAAVFGAVAAALAFDPRGDASIAVWLALSATFPVYAWSYDQLTLVVPIVVGAGIVARSSPRRGLAVGVGGLVFFLFAPTLLYVVADARQNESYNAIVPAVVLALLLLALWPLRRAPARAT